MRLEDPPPTFDPPTLAALRYSNAMTADAHGVSDALFAELKTHYSDPQIVELSCVIGLANYFNRFTTALRVDLSGSNRPYEEGPAE